MRTQLAACAGLLAMIVVYAGLRASAWVFGREPNPATLLYSAHTAYYWRSLTSLYAGAMIAVVVWILAERSEERVFAVLERALVPCVLAIVIQSLLIP